MRLGILDHCGSPKYTYYKNGFLLLYCFSLEKILAQLSISLSDNTFFLCVLLIATSCMVDPLFILVLRDLKLPFSLFFPPLIVLFTLGVGSLCGSFFFQFLFHFLGNLLLEILFALSPYIRLLPQADHAMVRVNVHGSLHRIVRTTL